MATIGNNNINAKLVLLGDMGAGKSSLVLRFVKGQFLEFQESTIGAAFFSQTLAVNDATVKFEIWDTAGQERYHSLAPMYYRGAAAAIIVYDISSTESFSRAKKWVQELQKQGNPNMVMALAGNKADLEEKRKVLAEASRSRVYAEENGLFFLETSAKTAANREDCLEPSRHKIQQEWSLWIDHQKDHVLQPAVPRRIIIPSVLEKRKCASTALRIFGNAAHHRRHLDSHLHWVVFLFACGVQPVQILGSFLSTYSLSRVWYKVLGAGWDRSISLILDSSRIGVYPQHESKKGSRMFRTQESQTVV
ncbi:hypothetical protein H6P81_001578 [Aristolochia fimbriata]|uniref:Rab5 n=1 Tax=Aristolochia fimbriata TaxID=158543 RepID=A0AAV7F7A4_ARIFI|nr:hypothetical protein H6P81_001578 [Aristolochia fimbriata]